MLTPFVTALVLGNCVTGLCLVASVALVRGADSLKNFRAPVELSKGGEPMKSRPLPRLNGRAVTR